MAKGRVAIPAATLTLLALGPGPSISAPAMATLFRAGTVVVFTGADGLIGYSSARPLSSTGKWAAAQARIWAGPQLRRDAAHQLYRLRYPSETIPSSASLAALRGLEGQRVKKLYSDMAPRHKVKAFRRVTVGAQHPVNVCLNRGEPRFCTESPSGSAPRSGCPRPSGSPPRTRGGHPQGREGACVGFGSSPHTRGSSPPAHRAARLPALLPAHAGVIPTTAARATLRPPPRTRGGHPSRFICARTGESSSPHTRGSSHHVPVPHHRPGLLPAHAGVIPGPSGTPTTRATPPRTRGGHPRMRDRMNDPRDSSPHTRGSSLRRHRRRGVRALLPAHAGVIPSTPLTSATS